MKKFVLMMALVCALAGTAQAGDLLTALGECQLFRGLSDQQLVDVAGIANVQEYQAGTEIITAHQSPGGIYLIITGQAAVTKNGRTVADVGPGRAVGEISFVTSGPATATVTLTEYSRVAFLPAAELRDLMERDTSMGYLVMENTARKIAGYVD